MSTTRTTSYWRKNITYVLSLLTVWFLVAYVGGIFLKAELDTIRFGGFKLGFWIAQQGAIYVFVVLIFVYVWLMNRLEENDKMIK